jgi:hypothetical protein
MLERKSEWRDKGCRYLEEDKSKGIGAMKWGAWEKDITLGIRRKEKLG